MFKKKEKNVPSEVKPTTIIVTPLILILLQN